MESQPFIIPEITLSEDLSGKLLAASALIKTELLRSVQLYKTDIVESVHLTRKRLKLFRAFLKLLTMCEGKDELKLLNTTFRNWGQTLSQLRDAHVHRSFINDAMPTLFNKKGTINTLHEIKKIAHQQVEQLEERLVYQDEIFKQLKQKIQNHSSTETFIQSNQFNTACIEKGFELSLNKSHKAFIDAKISKDSGRFHEWRKRLKDVQFQMELLRSHQNTIIKSSSDVEQLCELLGKDQDLNNFMHWLSTLTLEAKSIDKLLHPLKKSQLKLKHQLIVEGSRFYKLLSI